MNVLVSDDGRMLRSWFVRMDRGIYGNISLVDSVQRVVLSQSVIPVRCTRCFRCFSFAVWRSRGQPRTERLLGWTTEYRVSNHF